MVTPVDRGQQWEEFLNKSGLDNQEQKNSSIRASEEAAEHHHKMFHDHIASQEYYFDERDKVDQSTNNELWEGLMKSVEHHNQKAGFHENQYQALTGRNLLINNSDNDEATCSHCGERFW